MVINDQLLEQKTERNDSLCNVRFARVQNQGELLPARLKRIEVNRAAAFINGNGVIRREE